MSKLNLGCGSNKIKGFVNVDAEAKNEPDLVLDFIENNLPFADSSIEEVVLFHTIEHIEKRHHFTLLREINRVLKRGGKFILAYPEFTKCFKLWDSDFKGMKHFWEATMFGRQTNKHDYHVCIMHTPDFIHVLKSCGFAKAYITTEEIDTFNTIIYCEKVLGCSYVDWLKYEDDRVEIKI